MGTQVPEYVFRFEALADEIHADNKRAGWWTDLHTGAPLKRNVGELLMLVVSEIAEAAEGQRSGAEDDKLPDYPMFDVELADAKIRIMDIAGAHALDLSGAAHDLFVLTEFGETIHGGCGCDQRHRLLLIVEEISAAMEGHRKSASDAVLTMRPAFEVRLAAALLRIHHEADYEGFDLDWVVQAKRLFNARRADHKPENRRAVGGKAY